MDTLRCCCTTFSPMPSSRARHRRFPVAMASASDEKAAKTVKSDVAIVGAGIIGLTIARQLLLKTPLSVSIIDAKRPCAGATGAGQGYIWMGYRIPGNDKWDLETRSKQLWEEFVQDVEDSGLDPVKTLGWKKTGSLLVGKTADECLALQQRADQLQSAGIRAQFYSGSSLRELEPSLEVGENGGAIFVPDDSQIDARLATSFIQKKNTLFTPEGRYNEFFDNPVLMFTRSEHTGQIRVHTSENTFDAQRAIVIAAGVWSFEVVQRLAEELCFPLHVAVRPRKGHLLVLRRPPTMQLNHGLMELDYCKHQLGLVWPENRSGFGDKLTLETSVSMTATHDSMGNLVLGSSRQFSGFDCQTENDIVESIIKRGADFFPALRSLSIDDLLAGGDIRTGLRPYMPDGKPVIGSVPNAPSIFLATGHEGAGLCMAFGTAEMIADMIVGNDTTVDPRPFLPDGRCCD
eukprot:TRINITY_DN1761_c0_g1_i2.p1 TRINITY_DN1761_c0_g1~~TRINITY_DN1761_c0_g1_i2.p1  ORF type:complete len:461 (-),score=73.18 TRINITY_DN1761_c0_g1_i2:339-1721(-)